MNQTPQKPARLEARVTPEIHALLKRAAEIEGRTMTDFVVAAASAAARATIESVEVIRVSRDTQEMLVQELLDPAPLAPAMERAFLHHKRLIQPE